jgi:hypothetical protein
MVDNMNVDNMNVNNMNLEWWPKNRPYRGRHRNTDRKPGDTAPRPEPAGDGAAEPARKARRPYLRGLLWR